MFILFFVFFNYAMQYYILGQNRQKYSSHWMKCSYGNFYSTLNQTSPPPTSQSNKLQQIIVTLCIIAVHVLVQTCSTVANTIQMFALYISLLFVIFFIIFLILTFRGNDFRKDFKGLDCLKAFFPSSSILTLTATAPPLLIMKLKESLCLSKDCKIVSKNPNRENIFLDRKKRESNNYGYESYDIILRPIAESLLRKNVQYPLTIIYMKLKYCGNT